MTAFITQIHEIFEAHQMELSQYTEEQSKVVTDAIKQKLKNQRAFPDYGKLLRMVHTPGGNAVLQSILLALSN